MLEVVVTPVRRDIEAEDAFLAVSERHRIALDGEFPRYHAEPAAGVATAGTMWLDPWLTDLVYAPAIRNVALCIGGDAAATAPDAPAVTSLRIDEFLAAQRAGGIVARRWYRVHAPPGYSCRPAQPVPPR